MILAADCRWYFSSWVSGCRLQAAALPLLLLLLLLLLNAPQILFVSEYVPREKEKVHRTPARLLVLFSAAQTSVTGCLLECEITVPIAAQVSRKWSHGVFGLWNPVTSCRPHLVWLHYALCDTYFFLSLFCPGQHLHAHTVAVTVKEVCCYRILVLSSRGMTGFNIREPCPLGTQYSGLELGGLDHPLIPGRGFSAAHRSPSGWWLWWWWWWWRYVHLHYTNI